MKNALRLAALLLCLSLVPAVAHSQGRCTMQNIVGKYALTFTGASAIVMGTALDTFHWEALYGPIAGVGVIDIHADGTGTGEYWGVAGAWNFGFTPVPWDATIVLNDDCTGSFLFEFGGSTLIEKFVVLGNGREIRSVATQTAIPTGNWLSTAYRINGSCGQNKIHGEYLFQCKNLYQLPVDPPNIFGGAIHIRMLIEPGGDWAGNVYGKVADSNAEFPAYGHIAWNEDCTAEGTLETPFMPGVVSQAKGVFFDEGKRGYWMPLLNTMGDVTMPQPYGYCEITKIENK